MAPLIRFALMGVSHNHAYHLGGPHILIIIWITLLGSIWGPAYFGKLPMFGCRCPVGVRSDVTLRIIAITPHLSRSLNSLKNGSYRGH